MSNKSLTKLTNTHRRLLHLIMAPAIHKSNQPITNNTKHTPIKYHMVRGNPEEQINTRTPRLGNNLPKTMFAIEDFREQVLREVMMIKDMMVESREDMDLIEQQGHRRIALIEDMEERMIGAMANQGVEQTKVTINHIANEIIRVISPTEAIAALMEVAKIT